MMYYMEYRTHVEWIRVCDASGRAISVPSERRNWFAAGFRAAIDGPLEIRWVLDSKWVKI